MKKKPQSTPTVERHPDGKLKGGGSLNPGGLPTWVREVKEALRVDTQLGAVLLRKVIEGKGKGLQMKDRLRAVEIAFSYTLPKPKQQVELSGEVANPLAGATVEQLMEIVKAGQEQRKEEGEE